MFFLAFVFESSAFIGLGLLLGASTFVPSCNGHGLIESPPSRNMLCGVITKPDEILWGNPAYPECGAAFSFSSFPEAGYQFMSVLTHDLGRAHVTPLPTHVCSFDSESWGGAATPWDAYGSDMDWPTTQMTAGRNEFKWLIQWGSHFDDTESFSFYITKPDFAFDPSQPLKWDDFETEPFCVLGYDDTTPLANSDVIPLKDTAQFQIFCDVPERSGRHILYGEWGRNEYTFERFHGCVDVVFAAATTPTSSPITAAISLSPSLDPFIGAGIIALDGSASVGTNLAYAWSVSTIGDDTLYTIDDPDAAETTLTLLEPAASQTVMISLLVSNNDGSGSSSIDFLHSAISGGSWFDLGPLTRTPLTLAVGTKVSVRTVDSSGTDAYFPSTPLVLDNSNLDATNWPVALSQAIATSDPVAVGVLDSGTDEVTAEYSSTTNRIYARTDPGVDITAAYLHREEPTTSTVSPSTTTELPATTTTTTELPATTTATTELPATTTTTTELPATTTATTELPATTTTTTELPATTTTTTTTTSTTLTPPTNEDCEIDIQDGANAYWAGLLVWFETPTATLDFSSTGLDLGDVTVQQGVFLSMTISGQTITLTKPSWLTQSNKGYMGFNGNGPVEALATMAAPNCITV